MLGWSGWGPGVPLHAATLAGLGGWFLIYLWLASGNAPSKIVRGPVTTDLAEEPPAVAGLLASGFRLPRAAFPATLIDLAARKYVEISLVAGGHHLVHVLDRDETGLNDFERLTLEHVKRLAKDGVMPATALASGTKATTRRRWLRFRKAVIADSQARGLTVNRWSKLSLGVLSAGLTALLPTTYIAMDSDTLGVENSPLAVVVIAVYAGALALHSWIASQHAQRDTRRGLLAAGRWLGVRAGLERNESFRMLPPSAVAVWERHLAYAAAMGLAPAACAGLPFGPEDDHVAWSSVGGRWRRVRVSYPSRPWWGASPAMVGLACAGAALFGGFWSWFLVPPALRIVFSTTTVPPGLRLPAIFIAMVVFGLLVAGAYGLFLVVTSSMRPPAVVEGVVLRARARTRSTSSDNSEKRYYVAVDDGSRQRIQAVCVSWPTFNRLSQGDRVRMEYSPILGRASDVQILAAVPDDQDEAPSS
jgi:hypothetical protein